MRYSILGFLCVSSLVLAQAPLSTVARGQAAESSVNEESFTRYATPGECARVRVWHNHQFWRDKPQDTVYWGAGGSPDAREIVEAVRTCLSVLDAHRALSETPEHHLIGLVRAYIAAEQDNDADGATQKLLTSLAPAPIRKKAWALDQVVNAYLGAAHPNVTTVERYLIQLDALGKSAAPERLLAHRSLAQFARLTGVVPLWERELTAALAASHELTGDLRKEYAFESAKVWKGIAELRARKNDAPGAILAIETARTELIPLRPQVSEELSGYAYTMMGKSVAPVQATRWFNSGSARNIHPIPGKPALLCFVSPSGYAHWPEMSILSRLKTKFAARGLDIVLMTRTQGFWGTQLVHPDAEMTSIGEYFIKYGRDVGSLAVWQTAWGKRYDGRLTVQSSPNEEALRGGNVFIVDSGGTIRFVSFLDRYNEAMLEGVIESVL